MIVGDTMGGEVIPLLERFLPLLPGSIIRGRWFVNRSGNIVGDQIPGDIETTILFRRILPKRNVSGTVKAS
jgi:hypothetical protein